MAINLLACNCPCTNSENPCDCCPCITNVKIYSNISFHVEGDGRSCNRVLDGTCQDDTVPYAFNYTNSINSLIDIPNGEYSGIDCPSCQGVNFIGNASENDGFLESDLDYFHRWSYAAGTNCPTGATACSGSPPPGSGCPADVCLGDGQVFLITSNVPTIPLNFAESLCSYNLDGNGVDTYTQYYCTEQLGPYPNNQNLFGADFNICPSTSLFTLNLSFGENDYFNTYFTLSTDRSNGITFGYALLSSNSVTLPLYLNYPPPLGLVTNRIFGNAVIAIEFVYNAVTRNPETGECPLL